MKKSFKQPKNVYKDSVLHVGSNDCSDSVDVKAILGEYNELIDLAATAVIDTGTVRVTAYVLALIQKHKLKLIHSIVVCLNYAKVETSSLSTMMTILKLAMARVTMP